MMDIVHPLKSWTYVGHMNEFQRFFMKTDENNEVGYTYAGYTPKIL